MDVGMMTVLASHGWNGIGDGEMWSWQAENAAQAAAE